MHRLTMKRERLSSPLFFELLSIFLSSFGWQEKLFVTNFSEEFFGFRPEPSLCPPKPIIQNKAHEEYSFTFLCQ
jgi:hypothetical protein